MARDRNTKVIFAPRRSTLVAVTYCALIALLGCILIMATWGA